MEDMVVEASQDFVPLLMLTADRPPELLDTGANQAIDQVNHFGKFVKFFSLPPPTDEMPARMILTTIDSAVYSANIIKGANEGLLVVGAIQAEDEIWAALQLVKHLSWPTVPDILSGLRLRRQLTSHNGIEHNILFLDHLDHALLSGSVKSWLKPDVVVQIGGRVTSKRVSQFLELCSPNSYIFVDKHPYRHDPSHLITHRLQCSIIEFADIMLAKEFPERVRTSNTILREINAMHDYTRSGHVWKRMD
ncbi:hypothetical protein HPP92_018860 [Vanilla planifolia]|uniref:Menaquinone biosynthesis protein MenD middle domain-containing protein n=1 Tax=Vanilla planifolia TaxID=51239 RepID=A0A835UMD8_VANPL|nr:hypothetical protein HPP92_018860 [Vanilla planifolia]